MLDKSGVNQANAMVTPESAVDSAARGAGGKDEITLSLNGFYDFRFMVSLCLYMGEMRYNVTLATTELLREASGPTLGCSQHVMRIGR